MKTSRIREFKNFCLAAAILVAGASLASCSSSDDIAENNQQPVENPTVPKVYTMTIQASKGDDATTRALTLSGSTLNATWDAGEKVKVYQNGTEIGELTAAASDNASTTLTGSFGSAPNTSAALTFYFHTNATPSYSGQDGTLATIASTYDFCEAATVAAGDFTVDEAKYTISVPAGVNFGTNKQAIIKFTLFDNKANSEAISPSALTITGGTSTVELAGLSSSTNVLYVAFPTAGSAETITLTATVGSDTYTYEKPSVTFTNGNYYEINVKMLKTKSINAGPVEVPAGEHWLITGTVDGEGKSVVTSNRITIAEGAAVTLAGVNINGDGTVTSGDYAGITCEGNATIILKGANTVKGFDYNYPGIQAGPKNTTLTIDGTGSLDASSNTESQFGEGCSGIGSANKVTNNNEVTNNGTCGDIIIQGSVNVTARGGNNAAGIGSGYKGTCDNINIKGGTVTATGGINAAGIGSGGGGKCGNITITGGTIRATCGTWAACIGSGSEGTCGTVTIDGIENPEQTTSATLFPNFYSELSNDGYTWTLTHK